MSGPVWPMMRGHVYLIEKNADDPARKGEKIDKYIVILQGQPYFRKKARVCAVFATTTMTGRGMAWNVLVPKGKTTFWPKDTLITCADVYSLHVEDEVRSKYGQPIGALPDEVMKEVDTALVISLGLEPLGAGS